MSIFHNLHAIKKAEDIINSFITNSNTTVWIQDSKGNCIVPEGEITINYYAMLTERK